LGESYDEEDANEGKEVTAIGNTVEKESRCGRALRGGGGLDIRGGGEVSVRGNHVDNLSGIENLHRINHLIIKEPLGTHEQRRRPQHQRRGQQPN
jgi:hypothetical protein